MSATVPHRQHYQSIPGCPPVLLPCRMPWNFPCAESDLLKSFEAVSGLWAGGAQRIHALSSNTNSLLKITFLLFAVPPVTDRSFRKKKGEECDEFKGCQKRKWKHGNITAINTWAVESFKNSFKNDDLCHFSFYLDGKRCVIMLRQVLLMSPCTFLRVVSCRMCKCAKPGEKYRGWTLTFSLLSTHRSRLATHGKSCKILNKQQ